MLNLSEAYKNNAKDLKKTTKWQNWKIKLVAGGVAGSALTYFVWAWFIK